MTLRTARGHDQPVRDRALALEVDEDDVLGLVIIQLAEDQILDRGDAAGVGTGGFGGGRGLLRYPNGGVGRRFTVQRVAPLSPRFPGAYHNAGRGGRPCEDVEP